MTVFAFFGRSSILGTVLGGCSWSAFRTVPGSKTPCEESGRREDEVLGGKGPETTRRARDAFAMKVFVFIGCHGQDRSQHRAARVGSPPQDFVWTNRVGGPLFVFYSA